MSLLEWVIILIVTGWFLCTIIVNLNKEDCLDFLPEVLLRFLPLWTFFAPNPASTDFHLVYRNMDNNGEISDWNDARILLEPRKVLHAIWNPYKRAPKALVDHMQILLNLYFGLKSKYKEEQSLNSLMLTSSYLHLLNYINHLTKEPENKSRQFAILEKSREINFQILFISGFHNLHESNADN
jgi:hypothetical protein